MRKTAATAIAVIIAAAAWAAEGDTVMKQLKAGDYSLMVHLKSIPAEYREMAKATHHLSVMVMNAKNEAVTDAVVTYEFVLDKKVVASGELPYMAGAPMPGAGEGHHHMNSDMNMDRHAMCGCDNDSGGMEGGHQMGGGHYGADLTLPKAGEYTLNLAVKVGGKIVKATTPITAL